MKCLSILALCLMTTACIGSVPSRTPNATQVRYPLKQWTAPAGARVLLENSPDFGTAAVIVGVDAGSAQDPPGKAGLAHLVEHLIFHEKRNDMSLWNRLASVGGLDVNGITSWDTTVYQVVVPTSQTAQAMSLLASIFEQPLATVTQTDFERELQIVSNEMHLRSENGAPGQALNWLFPRLFPVGHAYRQPLGGDNESLAQLTLGDARSFASTWYRPSRATLVVSSADSLVQQSTWAGLAFQRYPNATPSAASEPKQQEVKAPNAPANIETFEAPVSSPELWIGWPMPSTWQAQGEVTELLPSLIESAFEFDSDNRRFDAAIDRIDADCFSGRLASVLYVKATLNDTEHLERTTTRLVAQLRSTLSQIVYNNHVFDYVRQWAANYHTYAEENVLTRALHMNASLNAGQEPLFFRGRDARLQSIAGPTIADAVSTYLTESNTRAVLVKPLTKIGNQASVASQSTVTLATHGQDRSPDTKNSQHWTHDFKIKDLEQHTLQSGLEVWVWKQPRSLYHAALLGFHGGDDADVNPGAGTALEWARRYSPLDSQLWGLKAEFNVNPSSTVALVRGVGRDVQASLQRLRHEVDFSVSWPPQEFRRQLAVFKRREAQADIQLEQALRQRLFGNHYHGRVASLEQIKAVKPGDLYKWLSRIRRADNALLVLVGDFAWSDISDDVETVFGNFGKGLPAQAFPAIPPVPTSPPARNMKVIFRNQGGVTQAKVSFVCAVATPLSDDLSAAYVYAQLLSNRLYDALRLGAWASYSVSPHVQTYRDGTTTIRLGADLDYARLPKAITELKTALDAAGPSLVDDLALQMARAHLAAESAWANATTAAVAHQLFFAWNQDWSADNVLNLSRRGFAIEADKVVGIETACRNSGVIGFAGDESRLQAAWDAQ